ncbi:unnamed protein product [Closterium sp. Naga37s-1]|nr:unnamed protein product [Closterium sp. Naga37s-1]
MCGNRGGPGEGHGKGRRDRAMARQDTTVVIKMGEEGKTVDGKKAVVVVLYGIASGEDKAQLVVIVHDVDPIELVIWLPALCRKMGVPYCILKSKSQLGQVIDQKTATSLALTAMKNEDKVELSKIVESVKVSQRGSTEPFPSPPPKAHFNDKANDLRRQWGVGIMGIKSQAKMKAREHILAKEVAQRMA